MLHLTPVPDAQPAKGQLDRDQLIAAYAVTLTDAQARGDWTAARLLAYRLQTLRQQPSPTLRHGDALVD